MSKARRSASVKSNQPQSSPGGPSPSSSQPKSVRELINENLTKIAPIAMAIGAFLNTIYPYVLKAWEFGWRLWVLAQPYNPQAYFPMICGLIMSFFGGHYFTLFAAIEAYKFCGYETTKNCLIDLYVSYLKVKEENDKDNLVDDDNDGIADVNQITSDELLTRKMSLILKSVDPSKVSCALSGLWMGFLAVVAVLRLKFAQTITLGATIGQTLEELGAGYVRPVLLQTIPEPYHKWIPVIMSYGFKTIGVSIAWTTQRVISAFYTSIKGAQMFAHGLFAVMGIQKPGPNDMVPWAITALVAWVGFYWQLSSQFALPFPLNVICLPLTIAEWFITWMVAVQV